MKRGDPSRATEHADRALLLSWPDISGEGKYALTALQSYTGDTVVTIGEWHDQTFGDYAPGATVSGMSFSADFQAELEKTFDRRETVPLANWPMFDAALIHWKRKPA